MIVIIRDEVFGTASPLALLAIFRLCFDERHILVTDPVFGIGSTPSIDYWLLALPTELRHEVMLVLEQGPVASSQRTNTAVRVIVGTMSESQFRGPIPLLTLTDALLVLHLPLRILVENSRHDGEFLLRIAPPLWRKSFVQALERRWLEFENGGGISELTARVRRAAVDAREWMRLWVMFDSDAREPGKPSQQSQLAAEACGARTQPWPIPTHQLSRRAIENYLPIQALFMWADEHHGPVKTQLRHAAQSFHDLQTDQRAHYNMKNGLLGDVRQPRKSWYIERDSKILEDMDLSALYQGLPIEVRRALHSGFGDDVATLFANNNLQEDWLRAEIPFQLRETLFQSIFDRI